jgi:hypothetical protein
MDKYYKYLKDNPKGYWFKRKIFGWGWVPVKWEGWIFLLIWVILLVQFELIAVKTYPDRSNVLQTLVHIILLVILLFLVCYKTGEKPRWQWGLK